MKALIYLSTILLLLCSCRSVRKTTVDIRQQKDSVAYSSVTKVQLDTTIIPKDTATLETILSLGDGGQVIIEQVKQDQGADISLNYSVEKTPSGSTKIKVRATTRPREVVTQNVTTEIKKYDQSSDVQKVETTKKTTGISPWHLAWLIPLILIGIVIYLNRKTILKYLTF